MSEQLSDRQFREQTRLAVKAWRKSALEHIQSIKHRSRRIIKAREYYEIDQSSMNTHLTHWPWPEMQEIAESKLRKSPRRPEQDTYDDLPGNRRKSDIYHAPWV